MAKEQKEHSFYEKEERCRRVFEWTLRKYGGVWHLCTPGEKQALIFKDDIDYVFAMTLAAMCAYDCPDVQIITFEIMGNHVHFILFGSESAVKIFFALFKKRLQRYLAEKGQRMDLTNFACKKPIPIETLESMRNQICYTNRNNFVVDPGHTPFSYPYGANSYFFTPKAKQQKDKLFGELTLREKRHLIHAREPNYPDTYVITDGYFSPMNYCRLDIGEAVFRDARHYFNKLTKNIESNKEIAAMLGDSIFYTDDELFDVVRKVCNDKYDGQRPALLGKNEKTELARMLHYDFNADNEKIRRMLNLSINYLDQIFPS
jgi:REP element-mobilizing transposase RayT